MIKLDLLPKPEQLTDELVRIKTLEFKADSAKNVLLLSCKKCNATKGKHDTGKEPIVNPFIDNPKDYFYMDDGFYRVKDASIKGKRTLDKLGLNDINHFVKPRRIVSEIITGDLSVYKVSIVHAKDDALSKCLTGLKGLIGKGNRKSKYAALYSTIILEDANFKAIETYLKENNLWDEELASLKCELEFCALPNPKIIHNL
jgi:hypothetical protein